MAFVKNVRINSSYKIIHVFKLISQIAKYIRQLTNAKFVQKGTAFRLRKMVQNSVLE